MAPQPIVITSEIYQVGGYGLTSPEDAAIYLIAFEDHLALIDAGGGRGHKNLLHLIASVGLRPERIECLLLTHCHFDHSGGARELRDQLGCPVVAHELDADFLEQGDQEATAARQYGTKLRPCPVDRRLRATRETIPLGGRTITALHIPGHSPGSVAYVVESAGQTVLFGQDVHGPLDIRLHSNRADYQVSLTKLLALDADILCEGHYGIFHGKPAVAEFIRSFLEPESGLYPLAD